MKSKDKSDKYTIEDTEIHSNSHNSVNMAEQMRGNEDKAVSFKNEIIAMSLISDIFINIIFLITELNIVWAIGYDFFLVLAYIFDYPNRKLMRIRNYTLPLIIGLMAVISIVAMLFQNAAYGGYYPATVIMVFALPPIFMVFLYKYQKFLNEHYQHLELSENNDFGEVFKFHFIVSANLVYGYFLSIPGRGPYYYRIIEPSRLSTYVTEQFRLTPSEIVIIQAKTFEIISGLCIVCIGLTLLFAILRVICHSINVFSCNTDFRIEGEPVSLLRFVPYMVYGMMVLLLCTLGYRIYAMGRYVELFYFGVASILLILLFTHYFYINHISSWNSFKHRKLGLFLMQLLIIFVVFWPIVIYMIELKSDYLGRFYYPSIALINVGQLLLMVKSLHVFYKIIKKSINQNLIVQKKMSNKQWKVNNVIVSVFLLVLWSLCIFFISQYQSREYRINVDYTYQIQQSCNDIQIIALDDKDESVIVHNRSNKHIDISGWEIVSDRGLQTYTFIDGTILTAGESLKITNGNYEWLDSTKTAPIKCEHIWNDKAQDNAILRNAEGIIVDVNPDVNYQNPYLVDVVNINLNEKTVTLKNNSNARISLNNWTFKIDRAASLKFSLEELYPFEEKEFELDVVPELLSIDYHTFMLFDDSYQLLFALIEGKPSPYYVDIICLDKTKERVYIKNKADYDIALKDWVLMSALGKQSYTFPNIILKPNEIISIGRSSTNMPTIVWQEFIWNNAAQDDAILMDSKDNYISIFVVYE